MPKNNLKYYLAQIPLLKWFCPFILGVVSGVYFYSFRYIVFSVTILFSSLLLVFFARYLKKIQNANLIGVINSVLLLLSIFFVSWLLTALFHQYEYKNHYSNYLDKSGKNTFSITIEKPIIEKAKSVKIIGSVNSINNSEESNEWISCSGKIIAYVQKDSGILSLGYGDQILVQSNINQVDGVMNPNEFDYKSYLSYQNIQYTSYVPSNSLVQIIPKKSFSIIGKIYKLRAYFASVLDKYITGEKEKAVANAILIGKKELLDNELVRSYSSSGAMHVLAVSGLHVGIIFIVFNSALSFFDKFKYGRTVKPVLLILLIWFYALLTGGSPSVLRAATMFSFITVGLAFKHYVNIYNTIAASAIIIIAYNPFIITEVGFQLSYWAVIGIIFLQGRIYKLLVVKNWLLDKIWAITAVSIAAQLATFPLGLLYFHQFPNLFWVSNLFVIPAAAIIVYVGVALLAFSWWSWLATILGILLNFIIGILNKVILFLDTLPFALSSEIDISWFQTILIYCFILAMSFTIIYRNKRFLQTGLLVALLFVSIASYRQYQSFNRRVFTVYYVPKTSAIEFIDGKTAKSKFDNKLMKNESQLLFRVKHNWWNKFITDNDKGFNEMPIKQIEKGMLLTEFENHRFLLVDSGFVKSTIKIEIDYLVVSHSPKLYLKYFSEKIKAKQIIFDSSNSNWKQNYWRKDCETLGLNCYFVSDNGAFEVEF